MNPQIQPSPHGGRRAATASRAARGALCAALALAALPTACGDRPPVTAVPPQAPAAGDAPAAARPLSVVVVVLDTTRADRCAPWDAGCTTSPRLAALAQESVTYREAWSPAGWTGPAHAALFTGLRPPRNGFLESRRSMLPRSANTLAEVLQDAGRSTGCFTGNPVVCEELGLLQGFSHAPRLVTNPALPSAPAVHAAALEFAAASRAAGRPFFVFVNDFEPHITYDPPPGAADAFVPAAADAATLRAARAFDHEDAMRHTLGITPADPRVLELLPALYAGEVAGADAQLGVFVDALRARGLLDDTLLIVCSDHGENLGEHGLWEHRFSMHRTICHVPLLVRFPDARDAGRVVDDVVRLEDVFPTVLEACGLPLPAGLDGASLLKPLGGRIALGAYGPNTALLAGLRQDVSGVDETVFHLELRTAFDGRHHLIAERAGRTQLFDVAADPDELHDVAAELPEVVARLRALLDPW